MTSDSTTHFSKTEHTDHVPVHSGKRAIKNRRAGKFVARHSLLTDLFEISHIRCIRNALIACFIVMILRQFLYDLVHYGRPNWTFELLSSTVDKLHIVAIVWPLMTLSTIFIVYYGTYIWVIYRKSLGSYFQIYDRIWLMLYIFYLMILLILPSWQIIKYQLPIVSSSIILAEQLRQLMKSHSFVREIIRKFSQTITDTTGLPVYFFYVVLIYKHVEHLDQTKVIEFGSIYQYVYFLFAPTLIYREAYPRTDSIQWRNVAKMFSEFLISLVLVYNVIANYWMPTFLRFFTDNEITLEFTISTLFDLMQPGVLVIILASYGFLHCWLNAFAELLRFADRMFYEDWWNFTSSATFWRSWNVVVHDWLYIYVYQDLSTLFNGNRNLSTIFVVLLSAIFHEYFMVMSLGFFSPIILAWFVVFGMLFRFAFPKAKGNGWNVVLLSFLPICAALIPYCYVLEVSARSFPVKRKTLWNIIFQSDQQSNSEL